MSGFTRAVKEKLKARVAFTGPTGSGKTWTGLEWATALATGGRIGLIDTEHRSASLYADHYDFDTMNWVDKYHPRKLAETVRQYGPEFDVLVIDSLTHFWSGEGGALDLKDQVARRTKNDYTAWGEVTPDMRYLLDTMLAAPCHIIVTMRSKMKHVLVETAGRNGGTVSKPVRIGLQPEMRAGIEYEFTLVCDMDPEHILTVTKSRCDLIADAVANPGRAGEVARTFAAWLDSGAELTPIAQPEEPPAQHQPPATSGRQPATTGHDDDYVAPKERKERSPAQTAATNTRNALPAAIRDGDEHRELRHALYALAAGRWGATAAGLAGKDLPTLRRISAQHVAGIAEVRIGDDRVDLVQDDQITLTVTNDMTATTEET